MSDLKGRIEISSTTQANKVPTYVSVSMEINSVLQHDKVY